MANEDKIDSLFSVQLIQAEQAKVTALLTEVKEKISKIGRVEIQLKGEKSIKGIKDATQSLNYEQKELIRITNEINKTYAKRMALDSEQAKILAEEKRLYQQRNQEVKNTVREDNSAIGSIERKRAALLRLEKTYDSLTEAARNSPEGKSFTTALFSLKQEVRELDLASGRTNTSVGNYNAGIKQVSVVSGEAIKTTKLLSDEVGKTEKMSDKATSGISKFYGGLRRLANIIPGLGISGVLVVGFELLSTAANAASSAFNSLLGKGYSFKKANEDINEELKNTVGEAAKAKVQIDVLTERTKKAGLTFQDKQSILKDYNKEFGKTIGEAKTYNEVESILINKAPIYLKILFLKARAQAAFNLAQKEASKQLADDFISNNELVKNLADVGAGFIGLTNGKQIANKVGEQQRKESVDKEITYTKIGAAIENEVDKLRVQSGTDLEKQATKDHIKLREDRTKKILLEAAKETSDLKKMQAEAAIEDAKSVAENEENNRDIRFNSAVFAFNKEKELADEAKKFRIAENEDELQIQLEALQKDLKEKKINREIEASEKEALYKKSNAKLLIIDQEYKSTLIQAQKNFAKELGAIAKDNPGKGPSILPLPDTDEEYEAQMKLTSKILKDTAKLKDEADKEDEKRILKAIEFAKEAAETTIAFIDAGFEKRKAQIQEEIEAVDKKRDKEIEAVEASTLSEQDKATKITQIKIKAQAEDEALQRKKRELDVKKAQFDRAVTIANIVGNTAAAVVKALPDIPLAIITGAIGALQLAKVLATPIPKFAKGTDYSPEGAAIVGEQGTEAIISPSGEVSLTPNRATLTYLERGSRVMTADKVEELLKNRSLSKIHIPKASTEQGYSREMTQAITTELKRLGGIIQNKTETHFNVQNGELVMTKKKGTHWEEWKNKYKI